MLGSIGVSAQAAPRILMGSVAHPHAAMDTAAALLNPAQHALATAPATHAAIPFATVKMEKPRITAPRTAMTERQYAAMDTATLNMKIIAVVRKTVPAAMGSVMP
jgi:hypothetical protein